MNDMADQTSTAVAPLEEGQVPAPAEATTILLVIERAAQNPNVDIDKMERLLQMHERIMARQAEADFNAAMMEAQSEMQRVAADAANPQTRSKYASYAALDRALRPIYTRHGFAVSFDTEPAEGEAITVVAHVSHRNGFTRTHRAIMPADGKGAKGGDVMTKTHAVGSAMTYGMRYLLKLAFNIATGEDDDDDGNAAGREPITAAQKEQIIGLIRETETDTAKFCAYMKVASVDEIRAEDFGRAIEAINLTWEAKKKKRAAEAAKETTDA
jgi:hypothetical protein